MFVLTVDNDVALKRLVFSCAFLVFSQFITVIRQISQAMM